MSRMFDSFKRIPRTDRDRALNSRALVLNAIFANGWPSGAPRPSLAQIRAVLMADAAMTRAQQARNRRVLGEHDEETS